MLINKGIFKLCSSPSVLTVTSKESTQPPLLSSTHWFEFAENSKVDACGFISDINIVSKYQAFHKHSGDSSLLVP